MATLPQGVTGDPTYQVGDQVTAVFTFSAERAEAAAAAAGETLPTPPPAWTATASGSPPAPASPPCGRSPAGCRRLVVARAVAPTGYSSGIPFATARDYLLSLPGMPDDVAAQLRASRATPPPSRCRCPPTSPSRRPWTSTGCRPRCSTPRDTTMAGVVWVDEGVVTAVVGSLSADEVLDVARGLQ